MSSSLDNTNSDHISTQNPSDTAQTDHSKTSNMQVNTTLSTDTFDNTQNETPLNLLHAGKFRDSCLIRTFYVDFNKFVWSDIVDLIISLLFSNE